VIGGKNIAKKISATIAGATAKIGTGGYAYPEWKGRFYPATLPPDEMLKFYASRLPVVELNNTFYRQPTPSLVERWREQAPSPFLFAVKAPQLITHIKRLTNCGGDVARFFEALAHFEDGLGPVLFQLPPNLKVEASLLKNFLAGLPRGVSAAFEFRHNSWFNSEVYEVLQSRNAALVWNDTDVPGMPFVRTADWGYLRLRRIRYTEKDLQAWADRLQDQNWSSSFVFFKHEDKATAPRLAERLAEKLTPTRSII